MEKKRLDRFDLIVAGGGPSGLIAATAGARLGAKTLLIERSGFLGGNATAGMVNKFFGFFHKDSKVVRGIPEEFTERITSAGGSDGFELYTLMEASITGEPHSDLAFPFNPEIAKIVADEFVTEAGVAVLFHTQVVGAVMEGNRIVGVVIESISGRREIRAGVVVDATGDAVVAKKAGAEVVGEEEDSAHARMPVTLIFRLTDIDLPRFRALPRAEKQDIVRQGLKTGEIPWESLGFFRDPTSRDAYCLMSRISKLDILDDESLSRAEMIGRQQIKGIMNFLRREVPGFETCKLSAIAPRVGIRQTRRIVGLYALTEQDLYESRQFEDAVALGRGPIHVHDHAGTGIFVKELDKPFGVPMRCLLPRSVEGFVATGRAISVTRIAGGGVGAMGTVMAVGQAAGTLAAVSLNKGILPAAVAVDEVQKILREKGAVIAHEDVDR
jgi:hypothetical protein